MLYFYFSFSEFLALEFRLCDGFLNNFIFEVDFAKIQRKNSMPRFHAQSFKCVCLIFCLVLSLYDHTLCVLYLDPYEKKSHKNGYFMLSCTELEAQYPIDTT